VVKPASRNKFVLRHYNDIAQVIGVFDTMGSVIRAVVKYNTLHDDDIKYTVKSGWLDITPSFKWWHLVVEDHYYIHQPRRFYYIITKECGMLATSFFTPRDLKRHWSQPQIVRG
jgi:hypothetical protein